MQSMSAKQAQVRANETGMVAIVVTVVLMMVISLIVIGYSQSIRTEQRQALDNQLSTQAFYAAESGVNLAVNKINASLSTNSPTTKNDCTDGLDIDASEYIIDSGTDAKITCLLVKDTVKSQVFSNVDSNAKSTMVYSAGAPIVTLTINWESTNAEDNGTNLTAALCGNGTDLLAVRSCKMPILRVDLVPIKDTDQLSQLLLQSRQLTLFLKPNVAVQPGSGTIYSGGNASTVGSPTISYANCSASAKPRACGFKVTGLSEYNRYALRFMSLYGTSNVTIGALDQSSTEVPVKGQYTIDSTAKAVDVTRRVQVRVSGQGNATETWGLSGGASSGGVGLCKQYAISGTSVDDQCD